MKFILSLFFCILFNLTHCLAQFPKHEIAVQYLDSTEVLFQQGKFKSSIVIGQKALQFFKAQRGMDTLTAKTYEAIGKSMISNGCLLYTSDAADE